MEVAGLALAIPGLVSVCLDIIEKVGTYKAFELESTQAIAQYEADKVRLKEWAKQVGVVDGKWEKDHDLRLENPATEEAVKLLLISTWAIFKEAETTGLKLRNNPSNNKSNISHITTHGSALVGHYEESSRLDMINFPQMSMRRKLKWTFRTKAQLTSYVEMFRANVDKLYALVSEDSSAPHLQQLSTLHNDIELLLEPIRSHSLKLSQMEVIDWLGIGNFDTYYSASKHYDDQLSFHLDGTCKWILSNPFYTQWASREFPKGNAKILWVCAPSGFGKTVLCANVIENFRTNPESPPLAHFFSTPYVNSGARLSDIIRSWIAQIVRVDPEALDLARGYVSKEDARQTASDAETWSLFRSIISQGPDYTLFLDGFDEFPKIDDSRLQFLHRLKDAVSRTAIRIFISSRDEVDIKSALSLHADKSEECTLIEYKISKEDLAYDIDLYSNDVVNRKLPNKDSELRLKLAQKLSKKSEGMFMWIKLHQQQLRGGKNGKELQRIVENMPRGLEDAYKRNWEWINKQDTDDKNRAMSILRWVAYALRPLTVFQLSEALVFEHYDDAEGVCSDDFPDTIDEQYVNEEIIEICGSLVETLEYSPDSSLVGSRTIQLKHPSVRDFLLLALSSDLTTLNHGSPINNAIANRKDHHNILAAICLVYLLSDEVWDNVLQKIDERNYDRSFLSYTARSWYRHIYAAGGSNTKVASLVKTFFSERKKYFDSWSEYFEFSQNLNPELFKDKPISGTPLYYAAQFDLVDIMQLMWESDKAQLDAVGGRFGTALQAACAMGHVDTFRVLISWGADPNVHGGEFGCPLNAAISSNQEIMVKILIDNKADITLQDPMGRTPVYTASRCGYANILKILLEAKGDISTPNKHGWTAMNVAAKNGQIEVMELLLGEGIDINECTRKWTPLTLAVAGGHLPAVEFLLENGADLNQPNAKGWTPLATAVNCNQVSIVQLLLNERADYNTRVSDGLAPLDIAAFNGYSAIVKSLLDHGADLTVTNWDGDTPLHSAAINGHSAVVRTLLDHGADATSANAYGKTPLQFAASYGHLEAAKALFTHKAGLNSLDHEGKSPLHHAVISEHTDTIQFLLDHNADISASSPRNGYTAIHYGSSEGSPDAVKLLLERKADFKASTLDGSTTLHLAAIAGHLGIIKLLIETLQSSIEELDQAFITAKDNLGRTCLHLAALGGHIECVDYLIDIGLSCQDVDKIGQTLFDYAYIGASLDVIERISDIEKLSVRPTSKWTPLHWACRTGDAETIMFWCRQDYNNSPVSTSRPSGSWTPASIGFFHANPTFDELSQDLFQALGVEVQPLPVGETLPSPILSKYPKGDQLDFFCDGCSHTIHGPRFHCRRCIDFDFCFMCLSLSEEWHSCCDWEEIQPVPT